MTDLERVESLAKQRKADEAARAEISLAEKKQTEAQTVAAADKAELRLCEFKKSLAGKLRISINRNGSRLIVNFGRNPLIAKPRRSLEISCFSDAFTVNYLIPKEGIDEPADQFGFRQRKASFGFNSLDSLMDHLAIQAADSINMTTDENPVWTEWARNGVGGICFAACWLLTMLTFGAWGFFFGWIPAIIVGSLAGALWPLLIVWLIWLAFK